MPYIYSKIEDERGINNTRNAMIADGHFGAGISDCVVVGINGDCRAESCPVYGCAECEFMSVDNSILERERGVSKHVLRTYR